MISFGKMVRTTRCAVGSAAALMVLGLAYTVAVYAVFTSRYPGVNDFYARWRPTRAWLLEGRSPYADAVVRDTQIGMYGRPALPDEDKALFSYPFFSILFFAVPALISSYAWASAVWLAVLQIVLPALVMLSFAWSGWRPPPWLFMLTLIFTLLGYHVVRTFVLGQFAGINALLMVSALLAVRVRRDALSGVLIGLATAKPQMAFLLAPALLGWAISSRRWAWLAWFAGTMALLLGGSFLLFPSWLTEWLSQLGTYVEHTFNRAPVAFMAEALFPGAGRLPELLVSGVLVAYLLWNWWQARAGTGPRFEWAVALTLVVTNLVALRTATTDYVMMTPVLFLLFRVAHESWGKRGLALILVAQAALFCGLWALFFITLENKIEQPPMYLPLPILLFIGLGLIRRACLNSGGDTPSRPVAAPGEGTRG